ncbi:SDR family NAD(P)-dependent oxidoreductase [Adhaeribacter aquaticus]|uniref:SDR family NAD(P)-dependent oxidoreductase n=1 Tax=Adhaeribacter aquaticus TaxID=299567 RepID=UPI00041EE9AA|nr:SDR family NAD(P)-dependent oxidoreductase [Adhaeribacter aquaticus]
MNYYFITGTSKGIGKALAEAALEDQNTIVTGISRNVSITHERYHHLHLDLSDITALRNNIHKVYPELREPDKIVLINNAGVVGEVSYIGSQSTDNVEFVFDVNVVAPAMFMDTFLSAYHHHNCPKIIINMSSGAGKRPVDGWAAYCASKAALDMLSLTCQKEQDLQKTNVKVFALSPGVVDTAMQTHIREAEADQFSEIEKFQKLKEENALEQPDKVAAKIMTLVNEADSFNEVVFRIDLIK